MELNGIMVGAIVWLEDKKSGESNSIRRL